MHLIDSVAKFNFLINTSACRFVTVPPRLRNARLKRNFKSPLTNRGKAYEMKITRRRLYDAVQSGKRLKELQKSVASFITLKSRAAGFSETSLRFYDTIRVVFQKIRLKIPIDCNAHRVFLNSSRLLLCVLTF